MDDPKDIVPDEIEEGMGEGPGPHVIRAHLKTLPNRAGVYRMFDAKGDVHLCRQGAQPEEPGGELCEARRPHQSHRGDDRAHRQYGIRDHRDGSGGAAARGQSDQEIASPRFNVTLRDDKSFPYILIRKDHPVTQIVKHRGARSHKGSYFGPFASAGAVNRTINALQKAFLLSSCSDSVYENRTRPCLLYQIKRCSAPCTGEIELPAYNELVNEAEAFLDGKSKTVKAELGPIDGGSVRKARFRAARRAIATASRR